MKKSNIGLRLLAAAIALCLIGMLLSIANGFLGNPISAAYADKAIKKYIDEKYPALDLELEKCHYNFKFSEYMANAKSKSSIDTHFNVYCRNGKVYRDDYKSYVVDKFNTLTRFENEYSNIVVPMLSKVQGLENNRTMVTIEKWEYEKANEKITIDMNFDKKLPIDMRVIIRTDLKDTSLGNIANILKSSYKVLTENGCKFTNYDIFSEYDNVTVMITNVIPSVIESGNLESILTNAKNNEGNYTIDNGKEDKYAGKDDVQKLNVYIKDNKNDGKK